jgi:hypothetical protein
MGSDEESEIEKLVERKYRKGKASLSRRSRFLRNHGKDD